MRKQELEFQADQIELVLRDHKSPARVTGGTVTPSRIQFQLQAAPSTRINRIESLAREIALALGVDNARVATYSGTLCIEVPRSDPHSVKLLELYPRLPMKRIPPGTAVLGLCDDGAPLLLRLPSPDVAHVLVSGTTGSGKTALLQSIVVSLALQHRRSDLKFVLIDPKSRAFEALTDLPHLLGPIASQVDAAKTALAEMAALMEKRDVSRVTKPRIVIVVDELADLIQTGGAEVSASVGRLVQRGREAAIHVIAATQKPSSSILGPLMKANFPVRLIGRVVSSEDARVAAGIGGTGAERLSGHGDFIAVTAGQIYRFQAAHLAPSDMSSVARRLAAGLPGFEVDRETERSVRSEDRQPAFRDSDYEGSP